MNYASPRLLIAGEWREGRGDAPFGGNKNSGIGSESGTEGMEAFLLTRTVHGTMQ